VYSIEYSAWETSQKELFERRKNFSKKKRKQILYQELWGNIKEQHFEETSDRISLQLSIPLVRAVGSAPTPTAVCESCYCYFNSTISFRTWNGWNESEFQGKCTSNWVYH
jgi:hypothetical protein